MLKMDAKTNTVSIQNAGIAPIRYRSTRIVSDNQDWPKLCQVEALPVEYTNGVRTGWKIVPTHGKAEELQKCFRQCNVGVQVDYGWFGSLYIGFDDVLDAVSHTLTPEVIVRG